jgi:hypothetical protein
MDINVSLALEDALIYAGKLLLNVLMKVSY